MLLSTQMWYISHKNVGMISDACVENPNSPKFLKIICIIPCQNREGPKYYGAHQILHSLAFLFVLNLQLEVITECLVKDQMRTNCKLF